MSYTLRGRIETRLAASLLPFAVAAVLSPILHVWWPLELMGVMLAGYGLLGPHDIYARSLGINVNLIWGFVLIAFAAVMLVLGTRHKRPR